MAIKKQMILVIVALVAALALIPTTANASLGKFINEGLSSNKSTATNRVKQLVEVNSKAAAAIAADMGVSSSQVDWNSLEATSQGTCKGYNTGQGAGGSVHTTTYGTYACWRFKVSIKGSVTKRFNMKHNCSNPLLKHLASPMPRSKVIAKMIKLTKKKTFKLNVQHTCPSGQVVNISVSGTVRITVKARSWTRVWGAYSQKLQAAVSASINGKIAVECGGTPPPPPPYDACVNIAGNQATVPNGMVINAIGNCVTQQITCGTGWYWSDVYVNCIQVVCGVVIVGDNNNVNIGDICSPGENPPPDNAPQISCVYPAHVFTGDFVYIWCEASDSDGDALSVSVINTPDPNTHVSAGHIAGVIPTSVRWDGSACPSTVSCYRATFWGDAVGQAYVTSKVTANGKSNTFEGNFPVYDGNTGF